MCLFVYRLVEVALEKNKKTFEMSSTSRRVGMCSRRRVRRTLVLFVLLFSFSNNFYLPTGYFPFYPPSHSNSYKRRGRPFFPPGHYHSIPQFSPILSSKQVCKMQFSRSLTSHLIASSFIFFFITFIYVRFFK